MHRIWTQLLRTKIWNPHWKERGLIMISSLECGNSLSCLRVRCCRHRRKMRRRSARTPPRNRRSCTWARQSRLQGGKTRFAWPLRPRSGRSRSWKSANANLHITFIRRTPLGPCSNLTWNLIMLILRLEILRSSQLVGLPCNTSHRVSFHTIPLSLNVC